MFLAGLCRRWLDNNNLTGTLPTELGLMTSMTDMCAHRPRLCCVRVCILEVTKPVVLGFITRSYTWVKTAARYGRSPIYEVMVDKVGQ